MQNTKQKPWQDTSLHQGWKQYFDECGDEWRRETKGFGLYHFFKWDDIANAFVMCGRVNTKKVGIARIHEDFIEKQFMNDCE